MSDLCCEKCGEFPVECKCSGSRKPFLCKLGLHNWVLTPKTPKSTTRGHKYYQTFGDEEEHRCIRCGVYKTMFKARERKAYMKPK